MRYSRFKFINTGALLMPTTTDRYWSIPSDRSKALMLAQREVSIFVYDAVCLEDFNEPPAPGELPGNERKQDLMQAWPLREIRNGLQP
jgi:hypothetical protein